VKVKVLKVLDVLVTHSDEIARQLLIYLNFSKEIDGEVLLEVVPTKRLQVESVEPHSPFRQGKYLWRVYTYPRLMEGRLIHSYGVKVNFTYILKERIMNLKEVSESKENGKLLVNFDFVSESLTYYDLVLGPMSFTKYDYNVLKGDVVLEEYYDRYSGRDFALLIIKSEEGKVQGILKVEVDKRTKIIPVQLHSDYLPENFMPFRVSLRSEDPLEQLVTNRLIMRLPDIMLA